MSIKAYCGLQGHGKTYQVVRFVIVPAIAQGRRVVTNIAGVDEELIRAHLVKEGADPETLGSVLSVRTSEIAKDNFFPELDEAGEKIVSTDHIVQPGDVVCIDECWKLFMAGDKLSKRHLAFFREHRHFPHPDLGFVCDIALITQMFADLHRSVRGTCEQVFVTKKAKEIGLSNYYSVDQYSGPSTSAKARISTYKEFYDPVFFPFYKSTTGSGAKEAKSDGRENILANPKKIAFMLVLLLFCGGALSYLYKFFHPEKSAKPPVVQAKSAPEKGSQQPGEKPAASQPGQAVAGAEAQGAKVGKWRIEGYYSMPNRMIVVVADAAGNRRYMENPPQLLITGREVNVVLEGEMLTNFSGPPVGGKK